MAHAGLPLTRDISFVYLLTWPMAALLLISSVVGLTLGPRGWYDLNPTTLPSFLGQDAISLTIGLPLLIGSALLSRRGSTRGLLIWMGTMLYLAYSYYFYVVGGRFNPLFPVHIGLVSMSMFSALALLFAIDLEEIRSHFDRKPRIRLIGGFLMGLSLFFAATWIALMILTLIEGSLLDNVARDVIAVDGVVLLPLTFFGGLWLWQRQPLGYVLAGLLLVKVTATMATLVINTLLVVKWGQPINSFQSVAFLVALLFSGTLLISYLRCVDAKQVAK